MVDLVVEGVFGIVEMYVVQILKIDDVFEGGEGFFVGFGVVQVVVGGESMVGIDVDVDVGFIFYIVDDGCEVFEFKVEVVVLVSGVFDYCSNVFGFCQCDID